MLLVVSDTNVLIDMEIGGLVGSLFRLGYEIVVADVAFEEELRAQHADLLTMGLGVRSLSPDSVARVAELSKRYRKPSRNDLFGLVLAEQEECLLLTGDEHLRAVAAAERVEVHGTLWVIEEMVRQGLIATAVAHAAYEAMQAAGRRLPWEDAHRRVDEVACDP